MSTAKKPVEFMESSEQKLITDKNIFQKGDWLLKWSPEDCKGASSGYVFYTPPEFGPEATQLPIGGTILAALFFMLENGEASFGAEMVARANQIADQMKSANIISKNRLN